MIFLAWTYFEYKVYNYEDFIATYASKPGIFKDSIKQRLRVHTSRCNFDNDTLFCLSYENKYWIFYWSSAHYQKVSMKNIHMMKEVHFVVKDFKSYLYCSFDADCPFKFGAQVRIDNKENIILGFYNCREEKKYDLSPNLMAYNLECSDIGIGSMNGYFDFDVSVRKSNQSVNLLLKKSKNRLQIILMISKSDEDLKIEDLLQLVT